MSENKVIDFLYPFIGYDIPLAIIETTEALWAECKRPQLHQKKRTKLGWEFYFELPVGMSYRDFANKEEYFRDAIGDVTTDMQHIGKMALLKVITNKIGEKYIYDFDHIVDSNKMVLPIPIGHTHSNLHYEDLSTIPHILIGGVTRSGKSNFIHTVTTSLLRLPTPPKIIIVDLKGLEYSYLYNHVLLATDENTANVTISRLLIEMRNRIQILKHSQCVNIAKYHKQGGKMDYIVLIIDELAELDNEQAQDDFETLTALSAATGICIIAATQRPDKNTFKNFGRSKSNLLGRLCFRMADSIGSRIILDNDLASKIPNIRGRAIWKLGKSVEVQVPYLDPELAEVMLNEQSTIRSTQGYADNRNIERVGNHGCRPIANKVISLLQSGTAKIKQISGAKKN